MLTAPCTRSHASATLHPKPREVCVTEDTESTDVLWFEITKLNRVKSGTRCLLQVGVRDWDSMGMSPSMIQKWFCEAVAEVLDVEGEGEDEMHRSKRPRVAERVPLHVQPEVEPQNRDFNVKEFPRSSPNPVVASNFGDSEIIQRAAVRRRYPVMKSRFLNFGDVLRPRFREVRLRDNPKSRRTPWISCHEIPVSELWG